MSKLPMKVRREIVAQWSRPRITWDITPIAREKRKDNREHRRSIAKILARIPEEVWRLDIPWSIYWRELYMAATASPPKLSNRLLQKSRTEAATKLKSAAQALEALEGILDPSLMQAICSIHGMKVTGSEIVRKERIRRLTDWHEIMDRIPFDVASFRAFSRPDLYGIEAFNAWKSPRFGGFPKNAMELLFYLDVPLSDILRATSQDLEKSNSSQPNDPTPSIQPSRPQAIHLVRYEKLRSFFKKRTNEPHGDLAFAIVKSFAEAEGLPDVEENRIVENVRSRAKRGRRRLGQKSKNHRKSPLP